MRLNTIQSFLQEHMDEILVLYPNTAQSGGIEEGTGSPGQSPLACGE